MRKTPYVVAFFTVVLTLLFNIIAVLRTDWLVSKSHSEVLHTTVTTEYGLSRVCETIVTRLPTPDKEGKISYEDYNCRRFPSQAKDGCDKENSSFCATWTGAGYVDYLSLGFSAVAPVAFLFGMSTHCRRRRVWRALAGLTMLQCATGIIAFALITDSFHRDRYPGFNHVKPGNAYILSTISWVLSLLVTIGIAVTGLAAEKGHAWAAGRRAYWPIDG
ncbi:hypothetical protein D9611_003895 [Ephemerocybe angulata]|uniref:Uncharacterized protein n=1 Tax=Ephemerocybe angulata TaxID=980116 RepID=A0A8H5B618_9AGAR|nr:hypothetical protein D9611_003895 [Tulosesus angulatus]